MISNSGSYRGQVKQLMVFERLCDHLAPAAKANQPDDSAASNYARPV